MHIYVKNIPAKFHPNPIWNDGPLDFMNQVERWLPHQQEQEKRSTEFMKNIHNVTCKNLV